MKMLTLGLVLSVCFTTTIQLPASLLEQNDEETRIFGGRFAKQGEFPWMVLLTIKGPTGIVYNCDGFLISKTHVLTAAHCFLDDPAIKIYNDVTGVVGSIGNVKKDEGTEVKFDKLYVHTGFDDKGNDDITILRLSTPIKEFDDNIQSICIAEKGKKYKNKQPVVEMGWGRYENATNKTPSKLKITNQGQILDSQTCIRQTGYAPGTGQLCIGSRSGPKTCEGDSGGPLCIIHGTSKLAIGIVSYGLTKNCLAENSPTMYTDIAYYADWIRKTIDDDDICWIL